MSEPLDMKCMTCEELDKLVQEKEASMDELRNMTRQLLEANDELREADSAKQKFLKLIKNEFNNPMYSLLNLSRRLAENKDIEQAPDIGRMLHGELLRMDFQLKNIFAITELESGLMDNSFSLVDLEQMVEDAKEEFIYTIRDKRIRIVTDIDEKVDLVTDAEKLFMILLNFVSNACEFSQDRTTVTVSLYEEHEKVVVRVEDDGSELPDIPDRKAIFNAFNAYNQAASRIFSGLGIGLSVAKSLAERLEGVIRYESGNGRTAFEVLLPKKHREDATVSYGSNEIFFDDFTSSEGDDAVEF